MCRRSLAFPRRSHPSLFVVSVAISRDARRNIGGVTAIRGQATTIRMGNHTILGRSLSSFACSYSVSMLSAERKKSDGCEISKRDERDIASIAKRCVLYSRARTIRTGLRISIRLTHHGEKMNVGWTHLFFIAELLNARSSSARVIMIVWNQ